MDRDLAKQFQPALRAREQKLEEELFREFSSANPSPMAQAPKPPQMPAPVPPNKAVDSASGPGPAISQPVAQAPH
jgi:hypothetical protein